MDLKDDTLLKMTYFDSAVAWGTVPVHPVSTEAFLAAAESFVRLFDAIGSVALLPVRADLAKNVRALQLAHAAAPNETRTLEALVEHERAAGRTHGECALTSLLWLHRGLQFTAKAFQRLATGPMEVSKAFSDAYPLTLKPHHTFFQRMAFHTVITTAPTRAYVFQRLGHPSADVLHAYFSELSKVVEAIPVASL
jgi:Glycolipid transfer protein (GLTP)